MKRLPLQFKILLLATILILIPIVFANIIYFKHKNILNISKNVVSSINNRWKSGLSQDKPLSREELQEKPLSFFATYSSDNENDTSSEDDGPNEDEVEESEDSEEEDDEEGSKTAKSVKVLQM